MPALTGPATLGEEVHEFGSLVGCEVFGHPQFAWVATSLQGRVTEDVGLA